MVVSLLIVILAVAAGVAIALHERRRPVNPADDLSGWLYFIAGEEGPVMVGTATDEISGSILLRLSPVPLRVVFSAKIADCPSVQKALEAELAPYRERGVWFDRDAALAYADHLREVTTA